MSVPTGGTGRPATRIGFRGWKLVQSLDKSVTTTNYKRRIAVGVIKKGRLYGLPQPLFPSVESVVNCNELLIVICVIRQAFVFSEINCWCDLLLLFQQSTPSNKSAPACRLQKAHQGKKCSGRHPRNEPRCVCFFMVHRWLRKLIKGVNYDAVSILRTKNAMPACLWYI